MRIWPLLAVAALAGCSASHQISSSHIVLDRGGQLAPTIATSDILAKPTTAYITDKTVRVFRLKDDCDVIAVPSALERPQVEQQYVSQGGTFTVAPNMRIHVIDEDNFLKDSRTAAIVTDDKYYGWICTGGPSEQSVHPEQQ